MMKNNNKYHRLLQDEHIVKEPYIIQTVDDTQRKKVLRQPAHMTHGALPGRTLRENRCHTAVPDLASMTSDIHIIFFIIFDQA